MPKFERGGLMNNDMLHGLPYLQGRELKSNWFNVFWPIYGQNKILGKIESISLYKWSRTKIEFLPIFLSFFGYGEGNKIYMANWMAILVKWPWIVIFAIMACWENGHKYSQMLLKDYQQCSNWKLKSNWFS